MGFTMVRVKLERLGELRFGLPDVAGVPVDEPLVEDGVRVSKGTATTAR